MNHRILTQTFLSRLLLFCLITSAQIRAADSSCPSYKPNISFRQAHVLSLRFGKNIKPPKIFGYYKGYRLNFEGDMCIFDEAKNIDQFILIFTERVKISTKPTGIIYLEREPGLDCRMFYLKKREVYKKHSNLFNEWIIEEEANENIPKRLPDNSLIMLIPPKFIHKIKSHKQLEKQEIKMVNAPITYLPLVRIKKTVSQKDLDKFGEVNALACLDSNTLHAQIKNNKRLENSAVISQRDYISAKIKTDLA